MDIKVDSGDRSKGKVENIGNQNKMILVYSGRKHG